MLLCLWILQVTSSTPRGIVTFQAKKASFEGFFGLLKGTSLSPLSGSNFAIIRTRRKNPCHDLQLLRFTYHTEWQFQWCSLHKVRSMARIHAVGVDCSSRHEWRSIYQTSLISHQDHFWQTQSWHDMDLPVDVVDRRSVSAKSTVVSIKIVVQRTSSCQSFDHSSKFSQGTGLNVLSIRVWKRNRGSLGPQREE